MNHRHNVVSRPPTATVHYSVAPPPEHMEAAWRELLATGEISNDKIHPHTIFTLKQLLERLRARHREQEIQGTTLAQAFGWAL